MVDNPPLTVAIAVDAARAANRELARRRAGASDTAALSAACLRAARKALAKESAASALCAARLADEGLAN
eukprot:5083844-Prymnesium_polylepis.1